MRLALAVLCAALLATVIPVHAHHSLAIYDEAVTATVTGIVTEYEWRNPHVLLHIRTDDMSDADSALVFEGGDIGRLSRLGWDGSAIKAGERAIVTYNPRRGRASGGHLIEVTTEQGEIFSLLRFRSAAETAQIPEARP